MSTNSAVILSGVRTNLIMLNLNLNGRTENRSRKISIKDKKIVPYLSPMYFIKARRFNTIIAKATFYQGICNSARETPKWRPPPPCLFILRRYFKHIKFSIFRHWRLSWKLSKLSVREGRCTILYKRRRFHFKLRCGRESGQEKK